MTNTHNYSFFGQSAGLTIQSASKKEPFLFFRFIKNKNGVWEKPSNGEGKTIKLSLEEMVMIIKVLRNETNSWSGRHQFKGSSTDISFNWESQEEKLWINVGTYSKVLNIAQVEVMKLLMEHMLKEKIAYATTSTMPYSAKEKALSNQNKSNPIIEEIIITNSDFEPKEELHETNSKSKEKITLKGFVKGETQKALLINFEEGEYWIPKSTIHSQFNSQKDIAQSFLIDSWVLKKNKIII